MPIKLDHVGLNTLIQEPVTASANTIGHNLGENTASYINSEIVSISDSDYLVSLNVHRNGPYGWPIFKQTRIGENPLTRYQKRNSIFTYTTEIGEVKILTKDGKLLDSTRARRSELRTFIETPVVSGFKPLVLIGSTENESDNEADADERVEVEVSFGNETAYFTDDLANKEHGLDDELDEAYEEFVDLYLDGGLDSDDSPFDEFELLKFSQTLYPKSKNSYSNDIRNRPTFESGYWKDSATDRTQVGTINNGFGFTVPSQSLWPLDVESDWKTRSLSATDGIFTASAGIKWKWDMNMPGASGLNFSSGSNRIVSSFSETVNPGTDTGFVFSSDVYQLSAEKGSLNSVEGTIRFWNTIERAMTQIGLKKSGSLTSYQATQTTASFVTGSSYKVPSINDSEYELVLNPTGGDKTKFLELFSGSFTLSFKEIGGFTLDGNGNTVTGEGTYFRWDGVSPSNRGLRYKKNSSTEHQVILSNNYSTQNWGGVSSTSASTMDTSLGGTKVVYTIDNQNRNWRGWSTVALEVPATEAPSLLVNGEVQSSTVTNTHNAYSSGVFRLNSNVYGPNISENYTGSFGHKINPRTSLVSLYPATSSAPIKSSNSQQFAFILTLKLGAKPSSSRAFSIMAGSGSGAESLSLTIAGDDNSQNHSVLSFVLQKGSLQSDTAKFDKVNWNIPIERQNEATKFYLYVDLANKANCFGLYHNNSGISSSMTVTTEGTLAGTVSGSFNRTAYLSKDPKFFAGPGFLDTDFTICDYAVLVKSDANTMVAANQFLHSGSALDYSSTYNSAFSSSVTHWYDFGSLNDQYRAGATLVSGTIQVGTMLPNDFAASLNDKGTEYKTITLASQSSGSIILDTGLPTEFKKYLYFYPGTAAYVYILTDSPSFTNLTSTGDNRITDYSLIKGVNRQASKYYANSGSNLYGTLDMTGSRLASAFPSATVVPTASIYYTFVTGATPHGIDTIQRLSHAFISNAVEDTHTNYGKFHISSSFAGAIQPEANGVGVIGQEGMVHSGSRGFLYKVQNLSLEALIENNGSYPVLGGIVTSEIRPSIADLSVGGSNSFNTRGGGGVLVNSYNAFNRFQYTSSLTIDQQYTASCIYTRRHSLITGSSFYHPFGMSFSASNDDSVFKQRASLNKFELYQGMPFWDAPAQSGRKPFFNDYNSFAQDPKLVGKDYSIIPEFKISEHIDKYLVSGETSFTEGDSALLKVEGGKTGISNSNDDNFYETYSTTEFLKNFDIIQGDNEGFVNPLSITLRCKAIKKLLPYKGFYPADRTVEIAQQFYTSYGDNLLFGTEETTDINPKYAAQNLLTPLFSPGILFNTIKSGVACDYPLVTSKLKTLAMSSSVNGTSGSHYINQQFDTRIPFEALVEPEKYLANVELISNEPDHNAAPSTTVVWNGQGDEKYRLMASNFLAEVGNFYLQNENYSSIASLPQGDPNFGNAKKGLEYRMRLRMYRSISGQKDIYSNIKPRNALLFPSSSTAKNIALESSNIGYDGLVSVSTWVRLDSWSHHAASSGSYRTILHGDFDNQEVRIFYDDSSNYFKINGGTGIHCTISDTTLNVGEWNNIVINFNTTASSWNSQVHEFFLNGESKTISCGGVSSTALGTLNSIRIGDLPHSDSGYYYNNTGSAWELGGSLQDFVLWKTNLNTEDATQLYNQGNWFDILTHTSASHIGNWWTLGEERTLPSSGSSIGDNTIFPKKVGEAKVLLKPSSEAKLEVFVTDGLAAFNANSSFSSPVPEGTFGVPQDTGSMSESITMYSRPSGFGPPQRLVFSGSSRYKVRFKNWEQFKKGNNISNYYHTSNSVILDSNTASANPIFNDLEYSNLDGAFVKGNDASEGYNYPFTPPYYHGEAWADITFKANETKKYTLSEIINSSSVEFLRYYKPYLTGSQGETTSWRLVNEDAMQLASSINIFSRGILPGTNTTDLDIANSYRWIMQSKFETPILDFSHMAFQEDQSSVNASASVSIPNIAPETLPMGMWHQYGKIPEDPKRGVFLQATDVPRRWIENATKGDYTLTASLADLCGFSSDPVRMGELGAIKEISEGIVAIPYVEQQGAREFFKISKRDIKHALDPKLKHLVGQSLVDMVERMKKFVLPPSMDFVINKEIEPFAMYIFEFTHTFTREDLSNMWQNLQPDIAISHEIDEVEISHELLFHELLGGEAKLRPSTTSNNEAGSVLDRQARLGEINPNLRWMVFKVKQRANNSYFDKIFKRNESNPDANGSDDTSITKKLNIGYNWPYDFFSLVELGKMEADIIFANADDENQEEKLVIKKRVKASKVLAKQKETDGIINNSLFGTGDEQPEETLSASDRAKIKPNPLGGLGRRRRKK